MEKATYKYSRYLEHIKSELKEINLKYNDLGEYRNQIQISFAKISTVLEEYELKNNPGNEKRMGELKEIDS